MGAMSNKVSVGSLSNWGIFIGLVVGSIIGFVFHEWGTGSIRDWLLVNAIAPIGDIFSKFSPYGHCSPCSWFSYSGYSKSR